MQINPWALPALLLTATSSFQQEKKHSSMVHSEHYRDRFCFKAPFPSSMSFALIYSKSEGSRISTPRVTLPWWRRGTGGTWLPRVPPVPLKQLPAPWHLSKAPEHPLALSTRSQRLLPPTVSFQSTFWHSDPSVCKDPKTAEHHSTLRHRVKHLQNTHNYKTAGSESFSFQLSLHD